MKIGIDISQIVYQGSGVDSYTRNLVKSLFTLDKKNEYILFGSSLRRKKIYLDFYNSLKIHNKILPKFYSYPLTFLNQLWNNLHVLDIERFIGKIQIFHTSDWIEAPARCAKVTTVHDLIAFKFPQFLDPLIVKTQRARMEWVRRDGTFIIADSENTKNDIVELIKIPAANIAVVYLGVSPVFGQDKLKANIVLDKYLLKGPYILAVGMREPRKNLQRVIEAFKQLRNKDLELLIVGKYGWGKDISPFPNVRILESVSDEELAVLYGQARCFIYPSLYEGFGLPVLEAMASGTLVITSDRGSLQEIAGKNAFFVNPESVSNIQEKIEYALGLSDAQRLEILAKGKQHAHKFTWEKTAEQTVNVYNRFL